MNKPKNYGPKIINDVSLSARYKNMMIEHANCKYKVFTEMPSMESFYLQKCISFLNASISNSVCNSDTTMVTDNNMILVSKYILFISSRLLSMPHSFCIDSCSVNYFWRTNTHKLYGWKWIRRVEFDTVELNIIRSLSNYQKSLISIIG